MRLKKILDYKKIGASLAGFMITSLLAAQPVAAQTYAWTGVCVGGENDDVATIQGFECLIANIFTVFIAVIGLAAFVMFIIASFRYLTSGGNTKGTETARNSFTFAVVGIIVSLSAFIILGLLADFTGIQTLTEFRIPTSI